MDPNDTYSGGAIVCSITGGVIVCSITGGAIVCSITCGVTNVYWSVIHGMKRKSHLSVVWNWYHFVAIAILHQPRPTDSADINT